MVFYLKYRPKTLGELDNADVEQLITKYLRRPSLPHAFLFTGPKGTGKTSTARILAKSINCTAAPSRFTACGECATCLSIGRGENLDVLEIDAASNRGIDEIRDLREKIKLAPTQLKFKVYIIDEVHMLTTEAFNALLKTLEEPPSHAVFILATTEAHKVPDTIVSRCMRVEFHRADTAQIIHSLNRIIKGEKLEAEAAALEEIVNLADGSFRDAAKILEEMALDGGKITAAEVRQQSGLTDVHLVEEFLLHLRKKETKELLELIQSLVSHGKNIRRFFMQVIAKLEQTLIDHFADKSDWSKEDLVRILGLLSRSFGELRTAVVPSLPFELAVVEYCESETEKTVQNVRQQVKVTDKKSGGQETGSKSAGSAGKVSEHWSEIIENTKKYNHSIAGVLRSCTPLSLADGKLTIEAAYKFHAERLEDPKVRDILTKAIKDMVGLDLKVEVVIKKR